MNEEWRPVVGFPDYAVSSFGRVRRVVPDRYGRMSGGALIQTVGNHGYCVVSLHEQTRQSVRLVHRLVCEAFHGAAPSATHQVAHGDGDRTNNHSDNLRWATPSGNNFDKRDHGTMRVGLDHHAHAKPECMPRGEAHGNSKLTTDKVQAIRADTRPQSVIAAEYGISQSLVSQVRQRRIWAHVA